MFVAHIEGATRLLGLSQGYEGLPVKDGIIECADQRLPVMTTAWTPTPAELDALNKGASIYVSIIGNNHPPILVGTGPLPEMEIESGT